MRFLPRVTLILSLAFCAPAGAVGQSAQAIGTGTISGRITIGDKPAARIMVGLMPSNVHGPERKAVARATTNADGQFRLINVPAGRYEVVPIAPAYVAPASPSGFRNQGKSINISAGETIEKIDFTLVRGGVITGRVTDAEGRPVIGENVRLAQAGQKGDRGGWFFYNPFLYQTDDRGIYRLYGLPPGRYLVSIGEDSKGGMVRLGLGRAGFYARTFHPGVTDEQKATVIEVTEGSEATSVDIALGRRAETFAASGRVVDGDGKPVPNLTMGYGSLLEGGKQMGSFGVGARTDSEGRFRFEGLLPGRYAAFAAGEQSESYSVPVKFEISEGDVTGLVVRVRRAASISGVAVVEGTSDRSILAKLTQLHIAAHLESEALAAPIFNQGQRINADGSFRLSGLSPGKVRIYLGGWPPLKGFSLLRVERDGVEVRGGTIEVPAGTEVGGVRLVFEYGSGVVRGQVRVENGTLPEGAHLFIILRRPGESESNLPGAEVDARGSFVLEGLPTGQYLLRLGGRLGQNGGRIPVVTQNVSVVSGTQTEVTLVLDLNAKSEAGKP